MYNLTRKYDFSSDDEKHYSKQDPLSQAIPDQSVSLKILVQRQKQGQEVRQFKPEWVGETSFEEAFPEWEKLDKIERLIELDKVKNNTDQLQRKLDEAAKARVAEERQKLIDDEVTRRTAETADPKQQTP